MGNIMGGECPQCSRRVELFTGGGLRDWDPEAALAAVPGDKELAAALASGAAFQIERRPAACGKCGKLIAAAQVSYRKGRRERTAKAVCPDCGGALTWLRADAAVVPCPNCGGNIPLARIGHWD